MRNLIKISLITSIVLSTNLLAFDPSEQAVINQIGNNTFQNSTIIQSMEKSVNTSITDTFEDVTKAYYGDYQVSYEPTTDSEIATVQSKGLSEEIYGSYNYNHDLDSGTITKTKVDKGLLERVSDLESSGGSSVDLTQVNNNINQNTTLANSAFTNANTAVNKADVNSSDITTIKAKNIAQDVVINTNTNNITTNTSAINTLNTDVLNNTNKNVSQDTDIANNASNISLNTSNISSNTNNITTNTSAINTLNTDVLNNTNKNVSQDTDIANNTSNISLNTSKNTAQDTQINSNTQRITTVEHNVSTLISNSNSQVNSRLDNQDRKISKLEEALAKTDKRENKKIASGMATNLNFDFTNGDRSFAMNHSNFNGENALGVGYAYRKNGTTISISLGTDFENVGVKTQASFSF